MTWIYVIIGYVILLLYASSITLRYLAIHAKLHKQKISLSLHDVINEIKFLMIHKEDNMDKGEYKNIRKGEPIDFRPEPLIIRPSELYGYLQAEDLLKEVKAPTLTDLLSYEPTEEDYKKVLDLLVTLCQLTYNQFSFFIAKSSDETKAANFMQITSPYHENTDLHKDIFRLAVKYNLDMKTLQQKFADRAAESKIIDLGDNVTIITNDGTNGLATAVQPIQSGIEGAEITFIFSFISTDKYEAWRKYTFPEPDASQENTDGK